MAAIAVETLLLILVILVLAGAAIYTLGRPAASRGAPSVRLVRIPRTADGREETYLAVNDTIILTVSNDGVRLSDFADQLEQLEAVATRLAGALGVSVEFARGVPADSATRRRPAEEAGIPMGDLPISTPEQLDELEARLRAERTNRSAS